MGNKSEFVRVTNILVNTLYFDRDIDVSVFETNIRGKEILNLSNALAWFSQVILEYLTHIYIL